MQSELFAILDYLAPGDGSDIAASKPCITGKEKCLFDVRIWTVCLRPDGSLDEQSVTMLGEIGDWMKQNGEAIYGSKAWSTLGEGHIEENGKLRKMPGGGIGQMHADFHFDLEDIRFTVGKDNSLYAFSMTMPNGGDVVRIKSMGSSSEYMKEAVKKVSLLGYKGKLEWKQTPEALEITFPADANLKSVAVFKIR